MQEVGGKELRDFIGETTKSIQASFALISSLINVQDLNFTFRFYFYPFTLGNTTKITRYLLKTQSLAQNQYGTFRHTFFVVVHHLGLSN